MLFAYDYDTGKFLLSAPTLMQLFRLLDRLYPDAWVEVLTEQDVAKQR